MPAAAVIPAPIAYIKVVAVKKLVVEPWVRDERSASPRALPIRTFPSGEPHALYWVCCVNQNFYFEKIRVFKAGICSNTLAWNNRIGRAVIFCWFLGPP